MEHSTLFDIIGPEIVGPSSSHTAGACRIGIISRQIFGKKPDSVKFILYNSFAQTGKGHGTDKGLLGGVLGLEVNDVEIKNSFEIAKQQNIKFEFEYKEEFERHPNSVDVVFNKNELTIKANSVGAGEIEVIQIGQNTCSLRADLPTLILSYKDKPGMVAFVTGFIVDENINIANMNCNRNTKGETANMSICTDSPLSNLVLEKIKQIGEIYSIRYIEALKR